MANTSQHHIPFEHGALPPNDPASQAHEGMHDVEHHTDEHVIVPWQVLTGILVALLFFTLLTVGVAKGEQWIAGAFNLVLPTWVNVMLAMSIATVKAALVCMYFMQLRYDKPLNTFVLLFCLGGVALFLGLTAIDLNNRASVEGWKEGEIIAGGTGANAIARPGFLGGDVVGGPIIENARARAIARMPDEGHDDHHYHRGALYAFGGDEKAYWVHFYEYYVEKTHELPTQHPDDTTDAFLEFMSHHIATHPTEDAELRGRGIVRRAGLSPALRGDDAHGHGDEHGAGHDEQPADHAPEPEAGAGEHAEPAAGGH